MRQNSKNTPDVGNRLIDHIAADKKKAVMAVCLITLMIFMWVRVFIKQAPSGVEGATPPDPAEQKSESKPALNISYIKLPKITGRHDQITRNFFVSNGWQDFEGKKKNIISIEEVNVVSGDDSEKTIKKVVEKIKLEAILIGENAKAYINGKVLSVGDKLLMSDGKNDYECEVVVIEENTVVIRCGKAEVKLKLRRINENKSQ
jgi:hypothetical protein